MAMVPGSYLTTYKSYVPLYCHGYEVGGLGSALTLPFVSYVGALFGWMSAQFIVETVSVAFMVGRVGRRYVLIPTGATSAKP